MGLLSANELFNQWLSQNKPNPSVALQIDPMMAAGINAAEKLGLGLAGLFGADVVPEEIKRRRLTEQALKGINMTDEKSLAQAVQIALANQDYQMADDLFKKYLDLRGVAVDQMRATRPRSTARPRFTKDYVMNSNGVTLTRLYSPDTGEVRYITPENKVLTGEQASKIYGTLSPVSKNPPEGTSPTIIEDNLKNYLDSNAGYGPISQDVASLFAKDISNLLRNDTAIRTVYGQRGLFDILTSVMDEVVGGGITLGGLLPKEWKLDQEEINLINKKFNQRINEIKKELYKNDAQKSKQKKAKTKKTKKTEKVKSQFFEQVDNEPVGGVTTLTVDDLMRFAQ